MFDWEKSTLIFRVNDKPRLEKMFFFFKDSRSDKHEYKLEFVSHQRLNSRQ